MCMQIILKAECFENVSKMFTYWQQKCNCFPGRAFGGHQQRRQSLTVSAVNFCSLSKINEIKNNSELATLSKDTRRDIWHQRTHDKMMRYWVLNILLIKRSNHALQLAVSENAHTAEWRFEFECFSRSHSHKAAVQTFTFEIRYSANSTWSNNVALLGK